MTSHRVLGNTKTIVRGLGAAFTAHIDLGEHMSATIIVGGQYGSEGKGKVTLLTALQYDSPWVVRCGGPNSGHTTRVDNNETILRQLPAAATHRGAKLALAAGCVVDEGLLIQEIEQCCLDPKRVVVDPRGVLVRSFDRKRENELCSEIASTGSGAGAAAARRMLRGRDVRLVEHSSKLRDYVTVATVAPRLHQALELGERVIVEGTQGFGLSLYHGQRYPYLTSKDTTASAFAMEAGIAPSAVSDVIMVVRTFPIRVGGPSGTLIHEISWENIRQLSGATHREPEYTSVTNRLRRVGRFDLEAVVTACRFNQPTEIAVMGLDRIDYSNRGVTDPTCFSKNALEFLDMLSTALDIPISWCGTGFSSYEAVNLCAKEPAAAHG